MVDIKK